MSEPPPLECVLVAADPTEGQAVCDALRAVGIDGRAVWSDEGGALEIFVPAESAHRARRIIGDGDWPRLA